MADRLSTLSPTQRAIVDAGDEFHNRPEVIQWEGNAIRDLLLDKFPDRIVPGESVLTTALRLLEQIPATPVQPVSTVWMETQSGLRFDPLAEEPEYLLSDLIWGCARNCRYGGQIKESVDYYSVAEHQVLMTRRVMQRPEKFLPPHVLRSEKAYMRALRTIACHDLHEGLVGDMTRPMKKRNPEFCVLEDGFAAKVAQRFGFDFPLPDFVKELDNRILVDERRQALNPSKNTWATDGLEPLGVPLGFWPPAFAAAMYTQLLIELDVPDAGTA